VLRKTRKHCDAVVAVSEQLKADMQADFPRHTIRVIGNHVDDALFHPVPKVAQDRVEFLHVSTLDERTKNPEGILCAFRRLKEVRSDFHLTIVSDEDYAHWQELARHFELQDHVSFAGPLPWDQVAAFYHRADAFVLFSNYESFSIVLAEAWISGIPAITTPVGIASEMPEYLGIHVPVDDNKALALALQSFIEQRDSYSMEKISAYGARYSKARILDEWDNLLVNYLG
jgi:glycosyltransferase involved in cell wall biosynthesis